MSSTPTYKGKPVTEITQKEYNVHHINTISKLFPKQRQEGKNPTFALTYAAIESTLVNRCGFDAETAHHIYTVNHDMYKVSIDWVAERMNEAVNSGYVTGCFGLRLRTPLIHTSTGFNDSFRVEAEKRTAGNMLGQSYCMLTMRAFNEFMWRVKKSDYANNILAVSSIHDSIYLYISNTLDVMAWVNTNLIECLAWQNLPELHHPKVKLGAELEICYPTWAETTSIPNNESKPEIKKIMNKALTQPNPT